MKPLNSLLRGTLGAMALMLAGLAHATTTDVSSPKETIPPNIIVSANRPMMMLVTSKDHTLFSPIYTDFEDVDGDGTIDTTFLPTFRYYGYFDSVMCYAYSTTDSRFNPVVAADAVTSTVNSKTLTRYSCNGKDGRWSGNFLNWASMTRLDVIRKLLYGGKRSTDTSTATVLERANLSEDSHGFVKYYRGTDIADYTPFSTANLTKTTGSNASVYAGLSICSRSDSDSEGGNPKLLLAKGNYKLWATVEGQACQWGAGSSAATVSGAGQLGPKLAAFYKDVDKGNGGISHEVNRPSQATDGALGSSSELTARVAVCVANLLDTRYCQNYSAGAKPFGLLQEFGLPSTGSSTARTEFGMISGSYDKNLTAGALRRNIGDLRDEINTTTGVFCHSTNSGCTTLSDSRTTGTGTIKAMDNIVLYGRSTSNYTGDSTRLPSELSDGTFPAWGNPIGEMVVQALQYYAGLSSTNPTSTTNDTNKSLPVATWRDPLGETGTINAARKTLYGRAICRPLNVLALSSSALSFDQFDGDPFATLPNRASKSLIDYTDNIGVKEGIAGTSRSVAVTSGTLAQAETLAAGCSAKTIGSLSSVLGICPEAPTTAGTYKVAGATFYANTHRVRDTTSVTLPTDLPATALKVKTYAASLTGGAPIIRVPIPVKGSSPVTLSTKSVFITPEALGVVSDRTTVRMPMSVLTFDAIAASGPGELPWGSFLVTWNNRIFGGDYDMDIAGYLRYDVVRNDARASGYDVKITTDILNVGMGSMGAYGYSVIGSTQDGRQLTHRHRGAGDGALLASGTTPLAAGYLCGNATYKAANDNDSGGACNVSSDGNTVRWSPTNTNVNARGDYRQSTTYEMVGAEDVTLKDPLWYAAKYGSFNSTDYVDSTTALPVDKWDNLKADGSLGADGDPDGYFLARRPDLLEQQLRRALDDLAKTANTAPALPSRSFGAGDLTYRVSFDSPTISGEVQAFAVDTDGKLSTTPTWEASKTLATQIGSGSYVASARNIITNDGNSWTGSQPPGRAFQWASLGSRLQAQMVTTTPYTAPNVAPINPVTATNADLAIKYIRGDSSTEVRGLRQRSTKYLGPVVNATPFVQTNPSAYYTEPNFPGYRKFVTDNLSRRKLLWVAANDGMLHAFNTDTGYEDFAYVPGVLANRLVEIPLKRGTGVARTQLDSVNFTQSTTESTPSGTVWPYVDASPYAGDVQVTQSNSTVAWRTYVFGALGRGGRAVYALDTTAPDDLHAAESNAGNIFKWQFTSDDDADLGYLVNDNQLNVNSNQPNPIAKLNNGKFALILNNGVKSTSGKAVLFLLYVDGPDPLTASWNGRYTKIVADAGSNNGLAPPTWIDLDKNGTADVVFAGDLKGNMWKFDLTNTDSTKWDVAYKSGSVNKPLFTATAKKIVNGVESTTDVALPITTAPEYAYPAFDGLIITFGTGNAFEVGDFPNNDVAQRVYGIWDRPAYTGATTANASMATTSRLVSRTFQVLSDGRIVVSDTPASINWTDNDGWYFKLPRTSEMVLSDPSLNGGFLTFTAVRPKTTTEDCSNEPQSSLYLIDPISGKAERNGLGYATVNGTRVLVSGVSIPDQKVSVVSTRAPTAPPSCTEGDPGCKCTGSGADKKCVSPLPPNSNCLQIQGNSAEGLSACYSANPRTNWREIPGLRTDR